MGSDRVIAQMLRSKGKVSLVRAIVAILAACVLRYFQYYKGATFFALLALIAFTLTVAYYHAAKIAENGGGREG